MLKCRICLIRCKALYVISEIEDHIYNEHVRMRLLKSDTYNCPPASTLFLLVAGPTRIAVEDHYMPCISVRERVWSLASPNVTNT